MLSLLKISDLFNIINQNNSNKINLLYICKEWTAYFINTTSLWTLLYKSYNISPYDIHVYKVKLNIQDINTVTQKEYKWLVYDRFKKFKNYYCKRCNLFNPHHLTSKGYCGGKFAKCMRKDSKIPCEECRSEYLTKWTGKFNKYMCKSCRQEKYHHYFIPKYERKNHSYINSKYICPSLDNDFSWNYESSHDNSLEDSNK